MRIVRTRAQRQNEEERCSTLPTAEAPARPHSRVLTSNIFIYSRVLTSNISIYSRVLSSLYLSLPRVLPSLSISIYRSPEYSRVPISLSLPSTLESLSISRAATAHPGCPWGRRGAGDGAARCRRGRDGGDGRGMNFGSDPALSLARELQHKMQ